MEIPRDLRPPDLPVRKRAAETARSPDKAPATGAPADQVSFGDADAIGRFVNVLKTMNPASLHKVEELRARIADGSYTADPEELADLLLGGRPDTGPSSGRRHV